jgi:hypothetical protein
VSGFELIEIDDTPVKAWTRGVPVEEAARRQLENLACPLLLSLCGPRLLPGACPRAAQSADPWARNDDLCDWQ